MRTLPLAGDEGIAKVRTLVRSRVGAALLALACALAPATPAPARAARPANVAVAAASASIEGYTDRWSYLPGETMTVYASTPRPITGAPLALEDILGRGVDRVTADVRPQRTAGDRPWEDGFGYEPTFRYVVPALRSGVYRWAGTIPFIVKSRDPADRIVVVYPSNTQNAYNKRGGRSLYTTPRATAVSFQRPVDPPVLDLARPLLEWLARGDLPVRYVADQDLEDADALAGAKVVVIIGHSEYWTRAARRTFDRFVDAGGDAVILSGNTMWWQVRYDAGRDRMICYKNTPDPEADPLLATTNWTAPGLRYPPMRSTGGDFDHGGYGDHREDPPGEKRGWDGFRIVAPLSPFLAGTGLRPGDVLSLPSREYDGAPIAGFDAAGVPILDRATLGFHRLELIGYNLGYRRRPTVGTWIVFQRTATSGVVVNTATTDWAGASGIGGRDGDVIGRITRNMLMTLLEHRSVFASPDARTAGGAVTEPWRGRPAG